MKWRIALVIPVALGFLRACSDDPPSAAPPADGGNGDAMGVDAGGDADAAVVGPHDAPLWKSGTRLRAQSERAGNAARFLSFFDTGRNESCSFRGTSDGTRCVPSGSDVIYDDDQCLMPAMVARSPVVCAGETATAYAIAYVPSADACVFGGSIERLFPVGSPTAPRPGFLKRRDGGCQAQPVGQNLEYLTVGAAVPLSAFVRATVVREDVSPALARSRYAGEDGSELIDGNLYDRARSGALCGQGRVGGGTESTLPWACLPQRQAYADDAKPMFSDPACATRAGANFIKAGCPPVDVILRSEVVDAGGPPTACGESSTIALYEVGPEAPSTFHVPVNTCVPRPGNPGERYFALGARIEPTTLPALVPTLFGDAGRMRIRALASAGAAIENGVFWDDTEKSVCYAQPFADGKRYCAPLAMALKDNIFKDAACSLPIVLASACGPPPALVVDQSQSAASSCAFNATTIYGVGTTKLPGGTQIWSKVDAANCAGPSTIDPSNVGYDVLGPSAVSSRLVEVTHVRE